METHVDPGAVRWSKKLNKIYLLTKKVKYLLPLSLIFYRGSQRASAARSPHMELPRPSGSRSKHPTLAAAVPAQPPDTKCLGITTSPAQQRGLDGPKLTGLDRLRVFALCQP